MPISEKALLEQIKPQLKKIAEDVVDYLYYDVGLTAIETFYAWGPPKYYQRYGELYDVIARIEPYETKDGYYCGIRTVPTAIVHTTDDPPELVYLKTFGKGYHGRPTVGVTSPSPWDRIHEAFKKIGKERK